MEHHRLKLDGRLVLVPHKKEETPPLKCSVQLIKEFLCDTLMSLSSSRYPLYLCLTCVVLVFFWHLSLTFDPPQDFTLWADSYKEHCFYCHWHIEEVWPPDFNQMGVLGRIDAAAGPSALRWSFYPEIVPRVGTLTQKEQGKEGGTLDREGITAR